MSNRAGTMNLCIPYNVIEPVMESLSSQSWFSNVKNQHSKEVVSALTSGLSRAPMQMTARLATTTITLKELLTLSVGDVIMTEKPAAAPVQLCVEDEPKYLAQIGQYKGNRALRVLRAMTSTDRR